MEKILELPLKKEFHIIGLMSGSSLDGLDIAYCTFIANHNSKYSYKIVQAETIEYGKDLKHKLSSIEKETALNFTLFDREYGKWIGDQVKHFIDKHNISNIDFVASHGHTIFHQPEKSLTVQIGHPAAIVGSCKLPVVADFRTIDVALGGQGAPLVPIGDMLLFQDYDFCLNIGGIANISYNITDSGTNTKTRKAFDTCPANMVFNHYAERMGKPYDHDGELAQKGESSEDVIKRLDELDYFTKDLPKSLGKEWITEFYIRHLESVNTTDFNKLASATHHAARLVSKAILDNIKEERKYKMLATGGGAFNKYLVSLLQEQLKDKCEVIIPDELTVQFKEALIFAFLGLLRWERKLNTLKSVTGASVDSVGGCVYLL